MLKRKRWIMYAIIALGAVVTASPIVLPEYNQTTVYIFAGIGGVIMSAALLWGYVVLRCPKCGAALPMRDRWADYCPKCGSKIP